MYEIEKDIPLPVQRNPRTKYAFLGQMEKGESVFMPDLKIGTLPSLVVVYRPKRFTGRTVTEQDVKGVRVWRIE